MTENPNLEKLRERLTKAMTDRLSKCIKCSRALPDDRDERLMWATQSAFGFVYQIICPNCQTPEQVAEGQIRAATESTRMEHGRIVRKPKKFDEDEPDGGGE